LAESAGWRTGAKNQVAVLYEWENYPLIYIDYPQMNTDKNTDLHE